MYEFLDWVQSRTVEIMLEVAINIKFHLRQVVLNVKCHGRTHPSRSESESLIPATCPDQVTNGVFLVAFDVPLFAKCM